MALVRRSMRHHPVGNYSGPRVTAQATVKEDLPVFINPAYAQASGATPGGDLMAFLPMVAIIVVFYFLLIRPQQKRAKETKAMLTALQKGDEIVTAGGVVGRIAKLTDAYASVEIAPNVEVTVQRNAISLVLPKGTIKTL
jgi:preprotein translocase subunit YajC